MIYIILGPPGAGKTTYVMDRAVYDDIVIDIDKIWNCYTMGRENKLYNFIKEISNESARIACEQKDVGDVYIITTKTKKAKDYLNKHKAAQLIVIDPGKSECIARIRGDKNKLIHHQEWKAIINKWYSREKDIMESLSNGDWQAV